MRSTGWHGLAHWPLEQTCPVTHVLPHPPQFALSLFVSAQ